MTERMRSARIFVSDLRLSAQVGVNPGEQGALQPIVVDLRVEIEDMERAARSERLVDTMDYVGIARTARRVVEERHYPLVESLAAAVARAILAKPGAISVGVKVRKLDCLRNASSAGVEVELELDDLDEALPPMSLEGEAAEEDVVVVGGGAAGFAAALWCWRLGHPALVVDPDPRLGGQLLLAHRPMTDLPGMNPMTGPHLARRLVRQLAGIRGRWLRASLVGIEADERGCTLALDEAAPGPVRSLRARTVVCAMGVRRRALGVPGERELAGRGLLATAALGAEELAGRRVVVVGGGDSACENALLLAGAGARVALVHRGSRLGGRTLLRAAIEGHPSVERWLGCEVEAFSGTERLEAVELVQRSGEAPPPERRRLPADAALVRVGWVPCSEALPRGWLDTRGFLSADARGCVAGTGRVFGAGDLLGEIAPSVATAFGTGTTAARAAVEVLELVDGRVPPLLFTP
jgi:thioredoxin reductase (NADPH)